MFCKKSVLENQVKFTEKHLCQSLFFNNVACLKPAYLLKKRLWHRYFPMNFAKFLRTPFFKTSGGCFCTYIFAKSVISIFEIKICIIIIIMVNMIVCEVLNLSYDYIEIILLIFIIFQFLWENFIFCALCQAKDKSLV